MEFSEGGDMEFYRDMDMEGYGVRGVIWSARIGDEE